MSLNLISEDRKHRGSGDVALNMKDGRGSGVEVEGEKDGEEISYAMKELMKAFAKSRHPLTVGTLLLRFLLVSWVEGIDWKRTRRDGRHKFRLRR